MRVLVATDTIGSLSSARAGALVATGWPAAEVTVVPLGEAGVGFLQAAADQLDAEITSAVQDDRVVSVAQRAGTTLMAVESALVEEGESIPYHASSADFGALVRGVLDRPERPRRLVVDLSGTSVHDGGAGFLFELGAEADVALNQGVAGLAALNRLDLTRPRALLAGVELIGVVASGEITSELLGLRGITSLRSRGARIDQSRLLDTDATLARWASLAAPALATAPGAGAYGGLGFAVLALGGRLETGPGYALGDLTARAAGRATDLVVTGCSVLDFARRGGGVVAEAARLATEQLSPCIAVAAEVLIGGRELRTMGIESAYSVRESAPASSHGGDVSEAELTATARRIGRSWHW